MKKIITIFFFLITLLPMPLFAKSWLDIFLDQKTMEASAGEEINLTINFKNTSKKPIRIYLVNNPLFRFGQLSITLGNFLPQPEPRPHGYVVSEKDFHLIAPGETKKFTQPIIVPKDAPKGKELKLVWTYGNNISKWPSGIQTLDGKTKKLFNGKKIPYIWTGKLITSATLKIQ